MSKYQKLFLFGILLLAVFFRFYLIKELPGGLFPDEAANGLDINLMAQGHIQPFYERGNGREALFFYLLAASVAIFGRGPWQHHIVSAGVGVLAVLLCFWVTKKLFEVFAENEIQKQRATPIALLAAFFMATSSWHLVLSRTAFRANLTPLFTSLVILALLYFVATENRLKKYVYAAVTGGSFALGFYTYIAYRIMVPFLAVASIWPVLSELKSYGKQKLAPYFKPVLLMFVSLLAVIAPLGFYFYHHPEFIVGRSDQVSIFNTSLNHGDVIGTFLTVTKLSLKAFFVDGDLNWRHNVSGAPFLSVLVSPFFFIGMLLTLFKAVRYALSPNKRHYDWKYFLLAGWFWSMLIPVIFTAEGIPHGLRSVGMIPAVFIIAALGLYESFSWIKHLVLLKNNQNTPTWRLKLVVISAKILAVVYCAAIISQSYVLYFIYAANSPENYYFFRSDLTEVSRYLNAYGSKEHTYLVLDKFSVQTTEYFTTRDAAHPENNQNQPYIQVDPEDSWKLNNLKPGDEIIFTESSIFDTIKFGKYHKNIAVKKTVYNQFGEKIMVIYSVTN